MAVPPPEVAETATRPSPRRFRSIRYVAAPSLCPGELPSAGENIVSPWRVISLSVGI